jgi:hypothetical protein
MTITIPAVFWPIATTLFCLAMLARPYHASGDYDFGILLRAGWLIPIGFVWAAYFAVV